MKETTNLENGDANMALLNLRVAVNSFQPGDGEVGVDTAWCR